LKDIDIRIGGDLGLIGDFKEERSYIGGREIFTRCPLAREPYLQYDLYIG